MIDLEQAIVARVQRGDVRVPAYPPAAGRLQRVLGQPGFLVQQVVDVLRTDNVLAATTLRVANSAFYARGEAVRTLSAAVVRIGSQQLHRLAVAAGTQRSFSAPGPLAGLRRRAWRQALTSAVVCEALAKRAGASSEEAFIGGLLHDIGRVLAITVLEELGETRSEEAWAMVERFHVELGMVIAARWMLPAQLEELIADHHARDAEESESFLRWVQASDQVVALLEQEPTLSAERLGCIGLLTTEECAHLAGLLPSIPALVDAFTPGGGSETSGLSAPIKSAPAAAKTRPVQLVASGPGPVTGELTWGDARVLTVQTATPGRANWLVKVNVDDLSFWANVKDSKATPGGGFEWTLAPFALSAEVAARWAEITAGLSAAAAA